MVLGVSIATVARLAVQVVIVWILVVWAIGLGYIAVTYWESRGRLPRRSVAATLHALVLEAWFVAWTQPMLPLFQMAGRRMSYRAGDTPVILVHGYFQNRVDFLYLARRLVKAGAGPVYALNFFWPQPFERSTVTLRKFTERVMRETGASQVDLLTHSSGGLLALDLLREHPEWIRRACVIAIPWRGVSWRGPVIGRSGSQLRADSLYTRTHAGPIGGAPVLSIYSLHDNLVHPASTSQVEGESVSWLPVEGPGHLAVLFDRRVGDAVCEFLAPAGCVSQGSGGSA